MLDGAARIGDLMKKTAELGQSAIATTDHGYLFGAYEFWSKAKAAGIKPIIGLEAYLTPGTARSDRSRVKWGQEGQAGDDVSSGGAYTHMTMWARDTAGMHNLFRLASYASLEGHFYKARMDRDLLQRYAKGIIATTGCPSGEVQTRLRLGQYDAALKAAREFQDIFGKDSFYVELMDHGLDIEKRVFEDLLRIAKDTIQVHGGIGFTWEHQAHLYFKRASTDAALLGSAEQHRSRVADLVLDTAPAERVPRIATGTRA